MGSKSDLPASSGASNIMTNTKRNLHLLMDLVKCGVRKKEVRKDRVVSDPAFVL